MPPDQSMTARVRLGHPFADFEQQHSNTKTHENKKFSGAAVKVKLKATV